MALHDDIHGWLATLPPWQQELFLRALSGASLDDRARDAVLEISLGDPSALASARRVRREDLPADLPIGSTVELLSIEHVAGVNRLAEGERLSFIPRGLNVVYGFNGSGKSGWARIPKHAGRAHHDETVLGDVYADATSRPRPAAVIRWQLASAERRLDLALDEPAPGVLAGMCVFDAACGQRLLIDDHEVDYIPLALETVRRLHRAQGDVAERVKQRLEQLRDPDLSLEPFAEGTDVRRLLADLSASTDVTVLRRVAAAVDEERRDLLVREIAAIDAANVEELARTAERDAARADALVGAITDAVRHLDADALTAAVSEQTAVAAAEQAAARLSVERFAKEPLSGAATDPWLVLWKAAKSFMREIHDEDFPVDRDGALCPTCMQVIESEARERLLRFEEWVRSDTEQQLGVARAKVANRVARLPDIDKLRNEHGAVSTAIADADEQLAAGLEAWFVDAERVVHALRHASDAAPVAVPPDIAAWAAARRSVAKKYRSLQDPAKEKALRGELAELRSREALAERLDEIERRIERLQEAARLRAVLPELDTTTVSNRLRTFASAFVTKDLESALRHQLRALNFDEVEVIACRTSGREGRPRVGLKVKTRDNVPLRSVLSEGEQRRLALAFFLAEVSMAYPGQPIVLDDPVCSIDHQGRRHIARELARIAQDRQVIVFTHELAFLHELQRAAAGQVQLHSQYVTKSDGRAGRVRADLPWTGKNVEQRIRDLNRQHQDLGALHRRDPDGADYERKASEFCTMLRQAFERAIEDKVLGGVVTRSDGGVHPKQLRDVAWSEEICQLSDRGQAENSPWVHDRSRAANPTPPTPDELAEGLDILKALSQAVSDLIERRRITARTAVQTPGKADENPGDGAEVHEMSRAAGAA